MLARRLARGQREAGGGEHRVAAQVQRRRAGVALSPREAQALAAHAEAAAHGGQRAGPRARAPGPARCAARGRPPSSGRCARGVAHARRARRRSRPARRGARRRRGRCSAPRRVGVEHAGGGARAEQAAAEARALLVGPVDERRRVSAGGSPARRARAAPPGPPSTPSAPSSQPPSGTESRWLPSASSRSERPGSVAHMLPAPSRSHVEPAARPGARAATRAPRARRAPGHALRAPLVRGQRGQLAQLGDGRGRDPGRPRRTGYQPSRRYPARVDERALAERLITYDTSTRWPARSRRLRQGLARGARDRRPGPLVQRDAGPDRGGRSVRRAHDRPARSP